MRFLLVDASRVLDGNGAPQESFSPTPSNGTIINEIGDGTVLSPKYPPPPDLPPDLPPYDIQFDPGGWPRHVGSVRFTVTPLTGTKETTVTDNFKPFAVSQALDGIFGAPDCLNKVAGTVTVMAELFSRPDARGRLLTKASITFRVSDNPAERTDFKRGPAAAETEAEVEVEVSTADGQASAAVALAGAAGAVGARSAAATLTSGSVSLQAHGDDEGPVDRPSIRTGEVHLEVAALPGNTPGTTSGPSEVTLAEAEGEAEVEVEAEAEARVGPGTAAAGAGSVVAVGATGVDAYLDAWGQPIAVPAESMIAADAASSTSTALSPSKLAVIADQASLQPLEPSRDSTSSLKTAHEPNSVEPVGWSKPGFALTLQVDTEAEVEVEVEVEAEAEAAAGEGAAAAAATGGVGVAAAGDFAAGGAYVSIATSTATNTVARPLPHVFVPNDNPDVSRQRQQDPQSSVLRTPR